MKIKFINFFLVCLVLVLSVWLCELAFRVVDGYDVFSLALRNSRSTMSIDEIFNSPKLTASARSLTFSEDVDFNWFGKNPNFLVDHANDDKNLLERYIQSNSIEVNYVYNKNFINDRLCNERRNPSWLGYYYYEPGNSDPFPRYRFMPNVTYPGTNLQTNQFGWRGHGLNFEKGKNTIRIAFVGASTTANMSSPVSYPEYVEHWLNMWARANNVSVNFECLNVGRPGVASMDFVSIVKYEVLALQPDLVVYYEGSNQFWPIAFVKWNDEKIPQNPKISTQHLSVFESYSALFCRIEQLFHGNYSEPVKEKFLVDWPSELDEFDPELDYQQLPLELGAISSDVRKIKQMLDAKSCSLMMLSFVWLADDKMPLSFPRDYSIYRYLNQGMLGTFTYKHIRRYADFQNRFFKKLAGSLNAAYFDMDSVYPKEPFFFEDAIHMNSMGVKLFAWGAFQGMLPEVKRLLRVKDAMPVKPVNEMLNFANFGWQLAYEPLDVSKCK